MKDDEKIGSIHKFHGCRMRFNAFRFSADRAKKVIALLGRCLNNSSSFWIWKSGREKKSELEFPEFPDLLQL